jgi:hypothetical protein
MFRLNLSFRSFLTNR